MLRGMALSLHTGQFDLQNLVAAVLCDAWNGSSLAVIYPRGTVPVHVMLLPLLWLFHSQNVRLAQSFFCGEAEERNIQSSSCHIKLMGLLSFWNVAARINQLVSF